MISNAHISLLIFICVIACLCLQHICDNRHPKHRNCMGKMEHLENFPLIFLQMEKSYLLPDFQGHYWELLF